MTAIIVRDLKVEDKSAALAVVESHYTDQETRQEFCERFDASMAPQPGAYVVSYVGAFKNDRLVGIAGYAESSMTSSHWELSWGTVLPEEQGKGIGKLLLEYRLKRISERITASQTFALVSTKPTRLYLDAGFVPVSLLENETEHSKKILRRKVL